MAENDDPVSAERSWKGKFRDALRGVQVGVADQSSFRAHLGAGVVVVLLGAVLRVRCGEWCILLLCIAGVLTAEMFNSALESMAKAITHERHPHLGDSLDIGSGAVFVASLGAAVIGTLLFANRLAILLGWW